MSGMKITVTIISHNEEKKIADAIKSAAWAAEVLVVDSESSDSTTQIAANLGAKVIVRPWPGFSEQKQFAVDSAENDWVLSLDADERVSDELRHEILTLKSSLELADGYRIPRLTYYMGRPTRHSGWYPDRQLRLFNRRKGHWGERLIHESVEMDPEAVVKNLKGDLHHFSIDDAGHHNRMISERYAPLAAEEMFKSGRRTSRIGVMTAGPLAFVRSYFLKAGVLDGFSGFCIARFAAHNSFLKHLLLLEMQSRITEK
jgi:glycosyltransferase involved in cell wall biosynthesis